MPDIVNPQITDAVTQANLKVLGDGPAVAMANLYQATAQALANAAHNATTAQQNANVVLQATTTQGVALIYAQGTSAPPNASQAQATTLSRDQLDQLIASLTAARDALGK